MRSAKELTKQQLVEIVDCIQTILYLDFDRDGDFWNPDKAWDPDHIDLIAKTLERFELQPEAAVWTGGS